MFCFPQHVPAQQHEITPTIALSATNPSSYCETLHRYSLDSHSAAGPREYRRTSSTEKF